MSILLFLQKILDKLYVFLSNLIFKFFIIFFKKKISYLSDESILFFKKNDYLKLENFLDYVTVKKINLKLDKITKEDLTTDNNILKRRFNKSVLFDKIFKNSDIYYDFPKKIFKQYNYLNRPEEILLSLNKTITNKVINFSELLNESFVSIEKFEAYQTLANGDNNKVNSNWHKDGDLLTSFKVLIYLNDVDENNGALKIISHNGKEVSLSGKSGTAIFFRASKLNHSGSVPKKFDRWCLNYKIYPKILHSSKIINKPFNYIRRYNLFFNF